MNPDGTQLSIACIVGAAFAFGVNDALIKFLSGSYPLHEVLLFRASTMTFYIQIISIAVCVLTGLAIGDGRFSGQGHASMDFLLRAWMRPGGVDLLVIASTGVCSAAGAYLITQAFRLGESGLVAPFEHALLPFAVTLGFVTWGEVPTPLSILGMALIVGSGVAVAVRETRSGARARPDRKPSRKPAARGRR